MRDFCAYMKISVITTTYNEEGNIAILCRRIKKVMGKKTRECPEKLFREGRHIQNGL
jgi:hypothetical protein